MRDNSIIIKFELHYFGARVILGTEEQFLQMSRFRNLASNKSTVLRIDCTFDLSSMNVTITMYKTARTLLSQNKRLSYYARTDPPIDRRYLKYLQTLSYSSKVEIKSRGTSRSYVQ